VVELLHGLFGKRKEKYGLKINQTFFKSKSGEESEQTPLAFKMFNLRCSSF